MPSWLWQGNFHSIRSVVFELSHVDRHNESTYWCQRAKKNLLMKNTKECILHLSLLQTSWAWMWYRCSLPRLVQFMFRSIPQKYRGLLQSPFIKIRSVDVLSHTKHNEPHQGNSVRVTDPSGVCVVQLCHRTGTVTSFWQQKSLTTDCIFLFPGWPLLSAETRAFCRILPVTTRLWGQF